MKTHTSKKAIYVRTLLLLPLMAVLLYGFSEIKVIETPPISTDQVIQESIANQLDLTEDIKININQTGRLLVQDELVALDELKTFLSKINAHLSTEQKQQVVRTIVYVDAETPKSIINKVDQILTEYGSATINIVGTDDNFNQKGATREQLQQFNTLAKLYNKQPKASRIVPLDDLRILEDIYNTMSEKQKADAQAFPECPVTVQPIQDGASRKLMAEYSALAKKYNVMLSKSNNIQIKKKDVDRLAHIYGLMSEKQKADAEPYPDFPPMPKPPKAPKAPKAKKGEKSDIPPPPPPAPPAPDHEEIEEVMELEEEAEMHKRDVLKGKHEYELVRHEISKEKDEAKLGKKEGKIYEQEINIIEKHDKLDNVEEETKKVYRIERGNKSNIPAPPTPPEPIAPVDYVIEMAKKDAEFYYEGKAITSDKAIELIKNNDELNIDSRKIDGKPQVVRLSTKPIVIDQ